jgi:hypothetical protein
MSVTVWIVRHGDKTEEVKNPFLDASGLVRSVMLQHAAHEEIKESKNLVAIYAASYGPNYNSYRPFATVMPLANAFRTEVKLSYTPGQEKEAGLDIWGQSRQWMSTNPGKHGYLLVAWEHRHISELTHYCGACPSTALFQWPSDNFDNVVTFKYLPSGETAEHRYRILDNVYPLPSEYVDLGAEGDNVLPWEGLYKLMLHNSTTTATSTNEARGCEYRQPHQRRIRY